MNPHKHFIGPPGARTNRRLGCLQPTLQVLADCLFAAENRQPGVLVAERRRQFARRLLARLGVEALALAPLQGDTRLPQAIRAARHTSLIVATLTGHVTPPRSTGEPQSH